VGARPQPRDNGRITRPGGGIVTTLYDFTVDDIQGEPVPLDRYRGKVLLVVNTASKCGFTPQYKGLESLYRKYRDRGLEVLGFPCNQFGAQEPGSEQEIATFCETNYDVTFPMFAKIDVNGNATAPVYRFLKQEKPGLLGTQTIKWNFTKFLVGRDGNVVARYAPNDTPESIEPEIAKVL
jgi:glutathione peroxidase